MTSLRSSVTDADGPKANEHQDNEDAKSVREWIDQLGFGWYQVQCLALCSMFILGESALLAMTSGVSSALAQYFGLTTIIEKSFILTCTYSGLIIGAIAAGALADSFGRRLPLFIGAVGVVFSAGVLASASSVDILYSFLFMLGCFAGIGVQLSFITISEVTPSHLRGICTAALGIAYCAGELYAGSVLRIFMPDLEHGPWHHLMLCAAMPCWFLLLMGYACRAARFDTVQWLAAKGRVVDVMEALNTMASLNGKPEIPRKALYLEPHVKGEVTLFDALSAVQEPHLRLYTLALAMMFFAKDFTGYGMTVFWPMAWEHVHERNLTPATELCCTAVLGIPGIFLAMLLMHKMPRRKAYFTAASLYVLGATCLIRLESGSPLGVVGVALFKLFYPTAQMVTMLLPSELFPTRIKGGAYALVAVWGRFATVIAPVTVGESHKDFLATACVLSAMAVLACSMLPETKDPELKDADHQSAAVVRKKMEIGYGAAEVKKRVFVMS